MGLNETIIRFCLMDLTFPFIKTACLSAVRHHFLIIFWFSAAILFSVWLLSSLNVTSSCQCIDSTDQCPLTALEKSSISGVKLVI